MVQQLPYNQYYTAKKLEGVTGYQAIILGASSRIGYFKHQKNVGFKVSAVTKVNFASIRLKPEWSYAVAAQDEQIYQIGYLMKTRLHEGAGVLAQIWNRL